MKLTWFILAVLTMAGALSAQQPVITPETPVNTSILHQWLHSGDPRLVAWAADFAGRTHDAQILAEIPAVLERWTIPPYTEDEREAAQRRAGMALLDVLIQENAKVPLSAIRAVAQSLPAEALVLISRLPLSESRSTLESWTWGQASTLTRPAFMMLANEPKPELVAKVVSQAEAEVQVSLSSSSSGYIGVFGLAAPSHGLPEVREVSSGWPQVYAYGIEENGLRENGIGSLDGERIAYGVNEHDFRENSSVIVNLDGDCISFRRFKENRPLAARHRVEGLDSRTRHLLIAHWLGIKPKEMQWYPVERFSIKWTDQQVYEQQLGAIVASEGEKLRVTAQALRQKGLLPKPVVATAMRWSEEPPGPRLVVTITCDMTPCPLNK